MEQQQPAWMCVGSHRLQGQTMQPPLGFSRISTARSCASDSGARSILVTGQAYHLLQQALFLANPSTGTCNFDHLEPCAQAPFSSSSAFPQRSFAFSVIKYIQDQTSRPTDCSLSELGAASNERHDGSHFSFIFQPSRMGLILGLVWIPFW